MRRPLAALLILACSTATAAAAQEAGAEAEQPVPLGTISGLLDQVATTWYAAPDRDSDLDPSGWRDAPGGSTVRLVGYPSEPPTGDSAALIVTFTAAGNPAQVDADAARVVYRAPQRPGELIAEGENVDLTLSTFEREGDTLVISGSVVATMTLGGAEDLVTAPEERGGVVFDGNFQAMVPPAE